MSKIIFNANEHSYTSPEIKYSSVSKLIGKFKKPYNGEYWSKYKAYQRILGEDKFKELKKGFRMEDPTLLDYLSTMVSSDELNTVTSTILSEWEHEKDKSIVKGNSYHEFQEKLAIEQGFCISPFDNKSYTTIESTKITVEGDNEFRSPVYSNLYDLPDGFHPELILWNDTYKLAGQSDLVFIRTENDIRYIQISDFKGLALDTEIPTPSGWSLMKNLKVGDEIFDGKGNITKIQHVSETHYNPCYKIIFDNNVEIIADHEHKWVVSLPDKYTTKNYKRIYSRSNKELTSDDIYDYYNNNTKKLAIEINSIKTDNIDLPIDPYVLGIWLADGNRTCGTLTCVNSKIWNEIENRGYKTSVNHNRDFIDKAESRTIFNIRKHLTSLNVLNNKHIPDLYLRSSYSQRLDLLRGYMDGDGYFNKCRNRFVMQTTNLRQAQDIQTLVSSLGFKSTILPYKFSGFGKNNLQAYSVGFSMPINPFLSRNENVLLKSTNRNYNYIKSIEKIETVPTMCLAVESIEKTYLATKAFIMTHNTNKKIVKSSIFGKMSYPLNHLDCVNYNHYRLQISTYAWMLERAGYKIEYLDFRHLNTPYRFDYMKPEVELMLEYK